MGEDKKTAEERKRGESTSKGVIEFGECVHRVSNTAEREKMEVKWEERVMLGIMDEKE